MKIKKVYTIGYSMIDNYIYFLQMIYNNHLIIDNNIIKDAYINNNTFTAKNGSFKYNGTINNNSIEGVVDIVGDNKILSSGKFLLSYVTKEQYKYINKFKSQWDWMTNNINLKKQNIYPLLQNPYKFINVMSFNICSTFAWTKEDGIIKVADILKYNNVDVVLLQEINIKEFTKLLKEMNRYGKYYGEYSGGIITKYKINRIYKRAPYSPVYGVCLTVGNKKIRVFNSHLEDSGFYSIRDSYHYQLPHLKYGLYHIAYNKNNNPELATIMAGDHNIVSHLDEDNKWPVSNYLYQDGWIDTYRETNKFINKNIDITFPNCETNRKIVVNEIGVKVCEIKSFKNKHRIDYIYSKNGKNASLIPIESKIINSHLNQKWPSDHNAVLTKFVIAV